MPHQSRLSSSSSTTATPPATSEKAKPLTPLPSASILLISPTNQILLLHRVNTSSSFPSAHVFPGGTHDAYHDGPLPADDPHADGPAYRRAALRECFEESGLLLKKSGVEVGEVEERAGVWRGAQRFSDVAGGEADAEGLVPFTRWVTPVGMGQTSKRFETQMYLYFMPFDEKAEERVVPTADGGVEHTEARFAAAAEWLERAGRGEVVLFPPQYFLLWLVGRFLVGGEGVEELRGQREGLREWVEEGGWGGKCISPVSLGRRKGDGRVILGLDRSGVEMEGSGREGVREYVVLVDFKKEGPRRVEVRLRSEVLAEEREGKEKL